MTCDIKRGEPTTEIIQSIPGGQQITASITLEKNGGAVLRTYCLKETLPQILKPDTPNCDGSVLCTTCNHQCKIHIRNPRINADGKLNDLLKPYSVSQG